MDLTNCSAIVTGGAGGLGGATSRRLVELGVGVVIFKHALDRAKPLAEELGPLAVPIAGDHNVDADIYWRPSRWPASWAHSRST